MDKYEKIFNSKQKKKRDAATRGLVNNNQRNKINHTLKVMETLNEVDR